MNSRNAAVVLMLLVCASLGYAQPGMPVTRISERGTLESLGLELKFNRPVFTSPRGVSRIEIDDIAPEYANVKQFFQELARKYVSCRIFKQVPGAVWGDTLKRRLNDGVHVRVIDLSQLCYLQFSDYISTDEIIALATLLPEVEYAHPPAQAMSLADPPNDPLYSSQWSLARIEAAGAWQVTTGSSEINVAIIEDGGLPQRDHPDLVNKWNVNIGEQGEGGGDHATRVAGIIAAQTNNAAGIASLGRNLTMSRYFFTYSNGPPATLAGQIARTADSNSVINCSFMTVEFVQIPNTNCQIRKSKNYESVSDAIDYATGLGVQVVAGYGNSMASLVYAGSCTQDDIDYYDAFPFPPYPASYSGVIAVSATGGNDLWAEGQNLSDPWQVYNYASNVHVAAPGMNVLTTCAGSGYDSTERGTSFATPHVSALVGLMLSVNPDLTYSDVRDAITSTADKVDTTRFQYSNGWNDHLGYGRINAGAAFAMVVADLAATNKSSTSLATSHNNQRKLYRESSGKLHEVFESGGEVFYGNSTDSGSSWAVSTRLTDGAGSQTAPCIAMAGSTVLVTWQVGDGIYRIRLRRSTNGGSSWLSVQDLTGEEVECLDPGPLPSVAGYSDGSAFIAYRDQTEEQIRCKLSTDAGAS